MHRGLHPCGGRALDVDGRSRAVVQHGVAGQAHCELALLQAVEDAGPAAAGGGLRRDGAVGSLRGARSARDLAVCGDLEDTSDPFRIIADAGVGDYRDVLDRAGGHHLEDYRGVGGDHLVGLAVHIDLERGTAVHRDVVLSVDRYHRDLAEHVQDGAGLGVDVVGDVIGHLVHVHLYQGALGDDRSCIQGLDVVLDEDRAEVDGRYGPVKGEVPCDRLAAHVAEQQAVIALSREGLGELAIFAGRGESHGLFVVRGFEELEYGCRLALAGKRVKHGAGDYDLLRKCDDAAEDGDDDGGEYLFHIP